MTTPTLQSIAVLAASDPGEVDAALKALGADRGAAITLSQARLAADWPDYVAARVRTGGAVAIVGGQENGTFLRLAVGRLEGRPAIAGLASGVLVFLVDPERDERDARAAA